MMKRGNRMHLRESGEMYLETILILSHRGRGVRAVDVSDEIGYSRPSVSRALGLLKTDGYLTADADGFLTLTEKGRAVAEKVYERHTVMTDFFVRLGVEPDQAAADACKMEHAISDESFRALKEHIHSVMK